MKNGVIKAIERNLRSFKKISLSGEPLSTDFASISEDASNGHTYKWEEVDSNGKWVIESNNEFVFDFTSTSGQDSFVCQGEIFDSASVFVNGVKLRNIWYNVSNNGTDTIIKLSSSLNLDDWVQVVI